MEIALEITAASPLWDDIPSQDIPPEYLLLAMLGILAPHYEVANPTSHTILSLWLKGVPLILDPSDEAPLPIDTLPPAA